MPHPRLQHYLLDPTEFRQLDDLCTALQRVAREAPTFCTHARIHDPVCALRRAPDIGRTVRQHTERLRTLLSRITRSAVFDEDESRA